MMGAALPGVCAAITVACMVRMLTSAAEFRVGLLLRRRLGLAAPSPIPPWLGERLRSSTTAVSSRVAGLSGAAGRRRHTDRDVLLLLESTTRRLRSGSSLRQAVASAATECSEPSQRELAAAIDTGAPLGSILDAWMLDTTASRQLVGTALRLAAASGGAVAPVLDGVAESLRDRLALDREVAALSSQARASVLVLIVAPAVFALLMATIDPRVASVQFTTPIGWICSAVGLLLDLFGALWMARMIARVR